MKFIITALVSASAALASAQFNNDVIHARVFNDAPGSTLTVTNTFPGLVEFSDSNLYNASGYANRHIWDLSPDGTANSTFGTTDYWDVSFGITLNSTGPAALDKEAGFILSNSNFGDSQFIVKNDGEVAMFGGAFTFHQFYAPNVGGDYQLGTTGLMELKYFNNGSANMLTASFTYNNVLTSFTDATTINPGTNIGGYGQFQITNTVGVGDSGDAIFSNINAAPEPASMVALGLGALALIRRRRIAKRS